MAKILLVEDDKEITLSITDWFALQNHDVDAVLSGKDGLERLKINQYDVAILDWGLPELSGIEILREYRATGGATPILMLTGRGNIDDKERGFNIGADDYLTKPFDLKELSARIHALLQRPAAYTGNKLKVRNLVLDSIARRVTLAGVDIPLSPREFALLEFFMKHPNQVFSSAAILNQVWPTDSEASDDALRATIKKLRKKVDGAGENSLICNVTGVGYRFDTE